MERRLPIYLLLDCSESMAGPAIDALNTGVHLLLEELMKNPLALETAYLSIITFSREARQIIPLTDILNFETAPLSIRPGTALGAALTLLLQDIQKSVRKTTETTKGDYKPLVFILTDGEPTDVWEDAVVTLRSAHGPGIANIYAIGCGPDVDIECLHRITDVVITMKDATPEAFRKLFLWLSASVQNTSKRLNEYSLDKKISMPPLPDEFLELVQNFSAVRKDRKPRHVFLHALCSSTRKPYLMRFALIRGDERYRAEASYPVEHMDKGDAAMLPPIHSSLLLNCPPCPYCKHRSAGMCRCGVLFCDDGSEEGERTCPGCGMMLTGMREGSFDVHQTEG